MQRFATGFLISVLVSACSTLPTRQVPHVVEPAPSASPAPAAGHGPVSVMTLNLAHARGTGFHQALQTERRARSDLDSIGRIFRLYQVQIAALQEADTDSLWSGGFDHVDYLSGQQQNAWSVHGSHVNAPGFEYGTALLTSLTPGHPESVRFGSGLLGLPKGFVISSLAWPGEGRCSVDVVSLHLDPLRASTRKRQVSQLVEVLRERDGPFIVMGDFNSDWGGEDSAVRLLAEEMQLKTWNPDASLATFPSRQRRLDWILISPNLEFLSYEVIPEQLSDHLAVFARVDWPTEAEAACG